MCVSGPALARGTRGKQQYRLSHSHCPARELGVPIQVTEMQVNIEGRRNRVCTAWYLKEDQ